jgi:hypothetical protein
MRKLKILALTTFAIMVVAALTVSVAGACGKDKTADASTAAVQGTEATVAGTGCTAAKGATATTAGVGCTASKGAHAATAGMGCSKMASCVHGASADMRVEAVRLPSGALAVFYTGTTPATVASLQARAEKGAAEFGCDLACAMAKNTSCHVEVANVHDGVMMLVTADKPAVLDEYQAKYEVAMAHTPSEAEAGE